MKFLLLVSVLFFSDPLHYFNWWAVSVGGAQLKWCQLAQHLCRLGKNVNVRSSLACEVMSYASSSSKDKMCLDVTKDK